MLPLGLALLILASPLAAELVRIEVSNRSDVLGEKAFGPAGPYERIAGRAYFAADPTNAANLAVADIGKAPRNSKGLVEYWADLYVLKPRDPARGNGAVLLEVSNRGGKGMLGMFNRAGGSTDPSEARDFGDGFLLAQGYTLVWLGWQFDVPDRPGLLRFHAPAAQGVSGPVRAEFAPDAKQTSFSLGDRDHIAYPAANPDDPNLTLTVRERGGARRPLPRGDWRIEGGTRVVSASGFEPGKLYELVYASRDPAVAGLGLAAIRDLISYLKHGNGNGVLPLADQRNFIKRAYGFGSSQSGRLLRTYLYYGFNRDEKKRPVFDGLMPHIAGGARGSFNQRFAQPSRTGHSYPVDVFPHTDATQTDPETGVSDGLLAHAGAVPKILYTNSSWEYWGRGASLAHTTVDGKGDAALPATSRIYQFAGSQHGPAAWPPRQGAARNLPNPNPFTWPMRALLVALDRWVAEGKEPPPSRYPRFADGALAPLDGLRFPKIPGVDVPTRMLLAYRMDASVEPPKTGKAFPMRWPQVDADGNETAGIRMPEIQTPLATYTGWNLRSSAIGAPGELMSQTGSFLPFAKTRAAREKSGDPRLSLEERYRDRADYLARFEQAARKLAAEGYVLERDVPALVERGAAEWDYLTK